MIEVTRLRGAKFVINADLIETIETTPDTVITLVNGHRYVVEESAEKIIESVLNYKRRIRKGCTFTFKEEIGGSGSGSC
ncbi:flagellar FlbD family protein [Acetomicrobium hydrogeniformans]|jgi:flagellar protein FlbD|uniref:Flagellar protein n=1 Tax=Acetomicrobium hydrogeniformans ATCC BAA-1850 TaxID=592015 RepID=A0A0T5XCD7_9BACT|nr:flagellar FlbD family protein [Acetomicrobium hydrogeniformans]KRT35614.1 flagellar protein [Acetomicrobium hydrogeniformans ATCC BAA-1850]